MAGYCEHCNNTGWIDCYCGGDLCICENNGEEPCFYCEGDPDGEEYDDYDEPEMPVRNTGDELGQVLADALNAAKPKRD